MKCVLLCLIDKSTVHLDYNLYPLFLTLRKIQLWSFFLSMYNLGLPLFDPKFVFDYDYNLANILGVLLVHLRSCFFVDFFFNNSFDFNSAFFLDHHTYSWKRLSNLRCEIYQSSIKDIRKFLRHFLAFICLFVWMATPNHTFQL